tara:strand:+ start:183 stop:464 length:282 start_codon:yes stop_codon:yes gene_type:complete
MLDKYEEDLQKEFLYKKEIEVITEKQKQIELEFYLESNPLTYNQEINAIRENAKYFCVNAFRNKWNTWDLSYSKKIDCKIPEDYFVDLDYPTY